MKNFKKVLALVLVVATLLSFATVAGAVNTTEIYADSNDVKYVEAVDVLTAIGVLNGKGASYKPNDTLKRSEAAKIIAMFDNGDTDISSLYNPANPFVDVAKDYWAISYIAYCAKQGIISGVGNNKFAPESKLTGIQFLKMVLVTLGYDAKEEGLVGTSWKVNVLKLARAAGLTDVLGKKYDYEAELTRDAAAQIMLNALNAKTVSYGQELKNSGKKTVLTTAGAIENDSYLYESWDLKKVEDQDDAFGRPCHIWKWDEKDNNKYVEIGTYADDALATYTEAVAGCDIIADADFDEDGVKLDVYEDGVKASAKATVKNTTDKDFGGQGVLTQVYEDRIVYVNTYLAKVTKVTTEKTDSKGHVTRKASINLDAYLTVPSTRFSSTFTTTSKTFESDKFAKDDVVLVTVAKGEVKTVELAESKLAEFSKLKKVDGEYSEIALDGEYSKIAEKYIYAGLDAEDLGNDMVAYFDTYGNVIGMEKYYADLNYAVIDALYVESVKGKATLRADLVAINGDKMEEVEVDKLKFVDGSTAKEYDADKIVEEAGATWNMPTFAKSTYAKGFYNKLMAYTTDDDGVYTLSMAGAWDDHYDDIDVSLDDTNKGGKFSNGSSYVKDLDGKIVFQMSDETVVLVQDTDSEAPFATYTSYTGYENVPSMTGKVQFHVDTDSKKADVVYVYDVSVVGVETVIFFAGADREAGAKKDGKFPIDFEAYKLDDEGKLTKATYTYKATSKDALKTMPVGFYKVFVNDNNEVTFEGVDAGTAVSAVNITDTAKVATGKAVKADATGDLVTVGSGATALVVDGGSADITTYAKDGSDLNDAAFADIANNDSLYVYKNTDNGKFTIVNAAKVATVKAVDERGNAVTGVQLSDDQTVGHTWVGVTINNLPEGMEVSRVLFGSTVFTAESQWTTDQNYEVADEITVELKWIAEYTVSTLKTTAGLGAVSGTTITATDNVEYTYGELVDLVEAALESDKATFELTYAGRTAADGDVFTNTTLVSNIGNWGVVVTAGNGTTTTYTFA